MQLPNEYEHPILFYDGECGMCNIFVQHLLKIDKKHCIYYAPIQGETAKKLLPPMSNNPKEWSLIYLDKNGLYTQSDASINLYKHLGGIRKCFYLGSIIPRCIRNTIYRLISRNRYRIMDKKSICTIGTPEQQAQILP